MRLRDTLFILLAATSIDASAQDMVTHFDMSLTDGAIVERVTNHSYGVSSQLPACTIEGLDGEALRFDGYSNYVRAGLPTATLSTEALTVSAVLAAETYPMMQVDVAETTPTYATICGNLDEGAKKGFALQLSSQGDLRLQVYVNYGGGYLVTVDGSEKLPRGRWCSVAMTFDKAGNAVTLHLNGKAIGTKKSNRCDLLVGSSDFYIGKDAKDVKAGPFLINTFCGAIDDISIRNSVEAPPTAPEGASIVPDFNYPIERYANVAPSGAEWGALGAWRPQFHGMPSGSWTNESHGMVYSGGRYHLFFQKNANGPYMSRLHWGHISSADLCQWREEPIAIYPGEPFDIKGCWSGCVYEQGGNTYLLYTAVDNERARIVQARARDENLTIWGEKKIVIDGRPAGLSDDFRDPYYFEADGRQYIIVGTSKNGIGACTLHRYEGGTWTNDGAIFFQGLSQAQHGTFWEMPNVTPMGDGRYLFTCTPLGTALGVRTLCWVGTISADGQFTPTGDMQYLEMGGIGRDGYGLLSPTICQSQTSNPNSQIILGIVPDKLPTQANYEMGWAHNFSLPRELSLAADGTLIQRPFSGLTSLRTSTAFAWEGSLQGTQSLAPVSGRQIELLGEFTVGTGSCGFHFLKSGNRQVSLAYNAANGMLTLDMTTLDRTVSDQGAYDGIYSVALPRKVAPGGRLKLHVYVDGSIADIFVNDTWAYSVRIFPNDAAQTEAEAFATADTEASIHAWTLNASQGSAGVAHVVSRLPQDGRCYDLQGRQMDASSGKGIYICNGRKIIR